MKQLLEKSKMERNAWINPENRKGVKKVDKWILFGDEYVHKTGTWGCIPNKDIRPVEGKKWELFRVSREDDEYYWGMPIEGLGMIYCMCPKSRCRELLDDEKKAWSGRTMGMFGSHSGNLSYTFNLGEI